MAHTLQERYSSLVDEEIRSSPRTASSSTIAMKVTRKQEK